MGEREEVTIIGAGPAGMAAAMYIHRAGIRPALLERADPGGLLLQANLVENYPGFPGGIRGMELVKLFVEQLNAVGVVVTVACVDDVRADGKDFKITTSEGVLLSRAVIVAIGTVPKEPSIKGARHLMGKRVFDDVRAVPPIGKSGEKAIILGGGDAAFDYALNLRGRGHDVTIVSRSEPRCLPLLRKRVEDRGVELVVGASPALVVEKASRTVVNCHNRGEVVRVVGDFVLLACGRVPNTAVLAPALRERIGQPKAPPETDVPGLYLAGDVLRGVFRQTGIAVGDGIHAAMLVERYLNKRRGIE
ncbi:MAG: NAD(P)/FAD-dependent oxidoreductase [Thermoplasmata archaeon]|nr:NAD(P)/FAD-dependent oxidoreductase [Thermoplasmata archaeon]